MKRKRGIGKNNPKKFSLVGANANQTGLDNFDNAEVESKMEVESPQGSTNMNGRQTGLGKQLINEKADKQVLCKTSTTVSGNRSKKAGNITTKSLRDLGSSSLNPTGSERLVQGERTHQEPRLPHQDPRYNDQELNAALMVLRKIMKMDAAGPFNIPVNPTALGIPDYFDVIDTPMDFGTICDNLEKGHKYMNSEDVFKDVQYIWDNCSKYNKKGDYILELMKRVKTNFTKYWTAAGLYKEQPQAINGYPHLPPPNESTMKRGKPVRECLESPVTDKPRQQHPVQAGLNQIQFHQRSSPFSQSHQPQKPDPVGLNRLQFHQPSAIFNEPQQPGQIGTADSGSTQKKTRGPTRCLKVWNTEGRIYIATNELGQPIGLEAPKLTNFLGTMARDGLMAPLTYVNWKSMPDANKENMWQQVEMKFEINPNSKTWVMNSLAKKWKDWKSKLKAAYYNPHETNEERLADRDPRVQPDQWSILISYWNLEEVERRSAINRANRAQQKFNHTTGTKSFARLREEEKAKRPDGKEPSQAELFIMTRTRKDGQPVNEESSAVISKLRETSTQQQETLQNSREPEDDILYQVLGKDSKCLRGPKTTRVEAIRMVSQANKEVHEMKEKMVSMEKTCAQMAAQMATMMSMMSSMQRATPHEDLRDVVANSLDASEGSLQPQVRSSTSRPVVPSRQTRAVKRGKMQDASAKKVTRRVLGFES